MPRYYCIMRLLTSCWVLPLLLTATFACDPDEDEGGDGDGTGDGDATGDGDGDGTGDGDSTGDGDGDGDGDEYCEHAWNGFDALDLFIESTNTITETPNMPGSEIREHGAVAVEAAEDIERHFSRAQEFVIDSDDQVAFDQLLLYQELWALPQAEIAASAQDSEQYSMASLDLLVTPGVAQAVADGALASGTIATYTLGRCSHTRRPQ